MMSKGILAAAVTLSLFLGPSSELRMPQWQTPQHIAEPEGERGRIDSFQFKSEVRGNERRIRLYLPPGYASSGDARFPLVVVFHGQGALKDAQMDRTLDNLIGAGRVTPLIAAFVPPGGAHGARRTGGG